MKDSVIDSSGEQYRKVGFSPLPLLVIACVLSACFLNPNASGADKPNIVLIVADDLGYGDGDFHTHISRRGREDWWHNDRIEMVEGYTTDLLTQYSVEFIEAHRKQPFFLYVAHLAIHFPWQGPKDPPHRQKGKGYVNDNK